MNTMDKHPKHQLSLQDWENLIDDFQYGSASLVKWTSMYPSRSLLDLALSSILKKDFPLKLNLIIFLEEFSDYLIKESEAEHALNRLVEALRAVVQSPVDGISITYSLKEQMMISITSMLISTSGFEFHVPQLESLTELLLTIINRPNHGPDRQTRAIAAECLRELERAYPCLLSEIVGHLWSLCQSERTHASQSYMLLLTTVTHNIAVSKINMSMLSTSVPLVPFSVPRLMSLGLSKEILGSNLKDLRRAMAFLLERQQILTPCAMMEFMSLIMPMAEVLELQVSLLKVQFSGLIYSYDPILCHVVLMMFSRFLLAFDGQEGELCHRLMLISREVQNHPVFRLLTLHWLLGLIRIISSREIGRRKSIFEMGLTFYPAVFDPLALKALKLDLLSLMCLEISGSKTGGGSAISVVKLFEDGLVSVSSFKWLPPWSTETAVAFRTFHKFLIGPSSHSATDVSTIRALMESAIFDTLQRMLVDMTLKFRTLVPVVVALLDRLLCCHKHHQLGECLLQTFDEKLLPKISIDYRLASYFAIFDRIAKNCIIPPHGLLELLTKYIVFLVGKHGPDSGVRSWSQGSKVLGISRTMMMHHHCSRLFLRLSRLLAYTCLYFTDLEVRDNARTYLRMLVCVPGKKLRHILNLGAEISSSPHSTSFFNVHSPRPPHDHQKSKSVSYYIHLERVIPLLVKQTWSLSLSTFGVGNNNTNYVEGIRDSAPLVDHGDFNGNTDVEITRESEKVGHSQEPLRVMDSKVSEILRTLRKHFSCIPDFRCMPGLKIRILCSLRLNSELFRREWGVDSPGTNSNAIGSLPAIYATVLTFSALAPYGSIPSCHIPFLLGTEFPSSQEGSTDMVPVNNFEADESSRASVVVEIEPREPIPGLVDVSVEATAEKGEIIRGKLQSITVGIEDMFLKAIVPSDIAQDEVPDYYFGLFTALWEACGTSSNTGRETFPMKGGKGIAAIDGTRSVKLLEVPANSVIQAVEHCLAPFVVSVIGETLVDIVKDGGIIKNVKWKDSASEVSIGVDTTSVADFNKGPLFIKYIDDEGKDGRESFMNSSKRNMGCFQVLIFLPPRFHLLFQMEVSDSSTLVRIRTDHWPCLAYIDDYLEALCFV